jgi:enoyl-CoA hydratase/carnithine racemase
MSGYQNLKYGVQDRVAVIMLDHPPVNAFNTATMNDLEAAFDAAIADPDVKAIVITGAGQYAFVAGADINELKEMAGDAGAAKAFIQRGQDVFSKIEASPKPVIAAVNAAAAGGGLELALACHMRIAADKARFGVPEITLGLIPGWGGTQRLPRVVGRSKATEMILTGDLITAQEAFRVGLVNKVVPANAVVREAMGLAKKLATMGALAMGAALEAIDKGSNMPMAEGLGVELESFTGLIGTDDAREGVTAFLEKRKPAFTDS